jgi:carboxylesterase type B
MVYQLVCLGKKLTALQPTIIGSVHNESTMFVERFGGNPDQGVLLNNGFRCGTAEGAKARYLKKVPVWRYHYSGTTAGKSVGAMHGQDIALVFGNGTAPLNKMVQTVWADFAKDHLNGLKKWNWPPYDPQGKSRN